MSDRQITLLTDGVVFPEGPRWYAGDFYFSDMYGHQVHRVSQSGRVDVVAKVENEPSGLGWLADGTMLIVSMQDARLLSLRHGVLGVAADLSTLTDAACNDMVVDARRNRAYIGSMPRLSTEGFPAEGNPSLDVTTHLPTSPIILVEFDADGVVSGQRIVADGLRLPNGLLLTPDGSTLVAAESGGLRLLSFDVADDGSLGEAQIWADLGVMPDGITLDAQGCIWVAAPLVDTGPSRYLRVALGGEIRDRIDVDTHAAMAVVLGGEDRRTLYMAESKQVLHATQRDNGRVRTTRVEVPGVGAP